jgi:hypothetical protein
LLQQRTLNSDTTSSRPAAVFFCLFCLIWNLLQSRNISLYSSRNITKCHFDTSRSQQKLQVDMKSEHATIVQQESGGRSAIPGIINLRASRLSDIRMEYREVAVHREEMSLNFTVKNQGA